ncbi:DUF1146 family protein [Lactobacillus agrestimuris]|uniref:DUF1146 family protein n=1 Tax=Lactobacillus agrestimuris TaxID=2941328 RepID=UPI0019B51B47|nr:DUF1146 family protein [Lactobacillus agrestimuris]MBD5431517.1 DUF1146 domain-containing protein [Lactobacillus sp.]
MVQIGIHAVISIIIYLVCIAFSFQAMKAIQVEKVIRKGRTFEAQVFLIFAAIGLGYLVASFFISFIDASLQLSNFF